jgi:N-acyl-D-aspartate/D-glutamate deacylase
MAQFDRVIKGGTIVDGLQSPRYVADIGIQDGRIASIGSIDVSRADEVLDATGQIVAPGFIDLHTHYDSQIYWDPYCTISGWHGVTSVVIGNCGFGFAPCRPEFRERAMWTMERNEAVRKETMEAGMPWDWETIPEFLDSLDRIPKGVNVVSYVGLGPLMSYVMGMENAKGRAATNREMAEMCRLLEEALDAGCCGISAQIAGQDSGQRDYDGTPMITDTMKRRDWIELCGVLKKKGRGFIQTLAAAHWAEGAAEASGRPVIFNAIGLVSDQHGFAMPEYREQLQWLQDCNARGLRIFGQALTVQNNYQFTLDTWNLFDVVPSWRALTMGTPAERKLKMADPALRAAIRADYVEGAPGISSLTCSFESIRIGDVGNEALRRYEGQTLDEIAGQEAKHPIDVMLDIAVADDLKTLFVTPAQEFDVAAMRELANAPFVLPGLSDGGAHMKFMTLGRYPTEFLTNLVRDLGLMTLEQAHWRLSTYPAIAAGFRDRGFLAEGMPADILVYDLERLRILPEEKLYDFPAGDWRLACKADGYRYIMVNGVVTFVDGVCTGRTPGRLLRNGEAR